MAEVPPEEGFGGDDPGAGGDPGADDMGGGDDVPPVMTKVPLSQKGDMVVWIFIACLALLGYLASVFWKKKGRDLWRRVTGAPEVDLSLYEIRLTSADGEEYSLDVVKEEDGSFDYVIAPPVLADFEDKYEEVEHAGHLEDENAKKKEAVAAKDELWALLKRRAEVTIVLAQQVDADRPQIAVAFTRNCITEIKNKSFKATQEFLGGQFKEIGEIAEILRPGTGEQFIRGVAKDIQHKKQMVAQRKELEKLQEERIVATEDLVVAPPGMPDNTELATYRWTIPDGLEEGDEGKFKLPSGVGVVVHIPEGKKGGDTLEFKTPFAFLDPQFREKQEARIKHQQERMKEQSEADMTTIDFKIPPGKKPGDECEIRLPAGRMTLKVPKDKGPGDVIKLPVAKHFLKPPAAKPQSPGGAPGLPPGTTMGPNGQPLANMPWKIPEGKKAGDEVEVRLPNGMGIRVKIPEGKKAGDTLNLQFPAAAMQQPEMGEHAFKVPEGKKGGDSIQITLPSGMPIMVTLPEGKKEGDEVKVRVPKTQLVEHVEFKFKVPAGKKGGDVHHLQLPTGQTVPVNIPPDKKEGDEVAVRIPKPMLAPPGPMGEFKYKVPSGKKPGDAFELKLPSGRPIRAVVPEGKKEGDEVVLQIPQAILNEPKMGRLDFKVPEGKKEGDECEIRLPSGQGIKVKIPPGKKPGDVIQLTVPAQHLNPGAASPGAPPGVPPGTPMATIPYKIPQDKKSGDEVQIRLPSGMTLNIKIPPNKGPGDTMQLQVPQAYMDPQFQQKRKAAMEAHMAKMTPEQRKAFERQQEMLAKMTPQQRAAFAQQQQAIAQMTPAQREQFQQQQQAIAQMSPEQRAVYAQQQQAIAQMTPQQRAQFQQQQQMLAQMSPQQRAQFIEAQTKRTNDKLFAMPPAQRQAALARMPPHNRQRHLAMLQAREPNAKRSGSAMTPERAEAARQAEEQKRQAQRAEEMAAQLLKEEEDEKKRAKSSRAQKKESKKNR